jgi:hypothetical protein
MADKKRLIYAEDALVGLQYISMYGDVNDTMIQAAMRLARSKIENAPTVDAVEVVRCKDCKKWLKLEPSGTNCRVCADSTRIRLPYDFCSYGERKAAP